MNGHGARPAASGVVARFISGRLFGGLLVGGLVVGLVVGLTTNASVASAPATNAVPAAAAAAPAPGSYQSLAPLRILDTRIGDGAPAAPVGAGATLDVTVAGRGGVPTSDVSAVVFNLTVVRPAAGGYVSAFPAGQPAPLASSLNFGAQETRAHLVIVGPGAAGQVSLRNGSVGPADLVADLVGYYTADLDARPDTASPASEGGEFNTLTPTRILDTRIGLGAPKQPVSGRLNVAVAGRAGVPSTGAGLVVLNLTATRPSGSGFLAASIYGSSTSSSVNFQTGRSASNLVVVPVSPDGSISVYTQVAGHVDVVADVLGYFEDGAPEAAGRTGAVTPTRLLDTRTIHASIPARGTITLAVAGHARVPATGVTAATVNVTVARPVAAGYLTTYPSDSSRPTVSTVSFGMLTVANLTLAPLGADGAIRIYNGSAAAVQVVVDVSGYVGPITGPLTWSGRTSIPDADAVGGVSCGSPTFCMAFGTDGAYRYDGSTWSVGAPLSELRSGQQVCLASGFCAALATTGVYTYDGHGWTFWPLTDAGDPSGALSALSCASATFCVAMESHEIGTSAWTFDGTGWTSTDIGLDANFGATPVSCTSPTFCLVTNRANEIARFDGTDWTVLTNRPAVSTTIGSLTCLRATFCLAISEDSAVSFNGAVWSSPVRLDVQTSVTDGLAAVSCSSAALCMVTTGFGYQLVWDGTSWSTAFQVDPAAGTFGLALSCTAPRLCLIVDRSGSVSGV